METCGLSNSLHTSQNKAPKKEFPFTPADMEMLKLKSTVSPCNVVNQILPEETYNKEKYKEADKRKFPQQENPVLCEKTFGYSLYQLYQEDKEFFKEMMLGKINEAYQKREDLKKFMTKAPDLYVETGIHILFHEGIIEILTQEMARLKELKLWCLRLQISDSDSPAA